MSRVFAGVAALGAAALVVVFVVAVYQCAVGHGHDQAPGFILPLVLASFVAALGGGIGFFVTAAA